MRAAWTADDLGKEDLSRLWRLEAVALWRSGPPLDAEQTVRVVDALRRAEEWEDATHTARTLLRDERLTVAAVASRLGYGSEASFAMAFKRVTGLAILSIVRVRRGKA